MNRKWLIMLKKELREVFRDKKSLAMMLITPLMIPLLVIGMSALFQNNTSKDINEYNKIGFSYELSATEKALVKEFDIKAYYKSEKKLAQDFKEEKINCYITRKDNKYIIHYDDTNDNGSYANSLANTYLTSYKTYLQKDYLTKNNLNSDNVLNIIEIDTKNIKQENFFASYVINYAFLFIIMAITISATYPATDTTAGEKERGTLETLLTMPIKSKDIIIGKFLSVSISSIITGLISLLLTALALNYTNNSFDIYKNVNLSLSISQLLIAALIIVLYSVLISGICVAISSMQKTFKEAQSALTPISFISFFPGMIVFMLNIKNSAILSLIPFVNYSLVFQDIASNKLNIVNILLTILSTLVLTTIVIFYIIKQYKSEKVLFAK